MKIAAIILAAVTAILAYAAYRWAESDPVFGGRRRPDWPGEQP